MQINIYCESDPQVHVNTCSELCNDEVDVNIYYELGLSNYMKISALNTLQVSSVYRQQSGDGPSNLSAGGYQYTALN